MHLDKETLEVDARDYVKIWIYPFYSINQYSLPSWYKKLIIDCLIQIYDCWQKELDSLNKHYYLKIWVFEKEFMQSQVVVAVDKFVHAYDNSFEGLSKIEKLPSRLRTEKSKELEWQQGFIVSAFTEKELMNCLKENSYSQKEINEIKKIRI